MTLPGSKRLRTLVALGIVGIVAAAAVSTAASARPDAAQGSKLRIGYVLPDLANPFIAGLRDGAVVEAKKQGIDLLVKGTNDSKGQTDAMLAYVGAKVDAIGVDAIDGAAISPAVKAANKAGIPVIAIQAQPSSGKVATFIAAEQQAGRRTDRQGRSSRTARARTRASSASSRGTSPTSRVGTRTRGCVP